MSVNKKASNFANWTNKMLKQQQANHTQNPAIQVQSLANPYPNVISNTNSSNQPAYVQYYQPQYINSGSSNYISPGFYSPLIGTYESLKITEILTLFPTLTNDAIQGEMKAVKLLLDRIYFDLGGGVDRYAIEGEFMRQLSDIVRRDGY